VSHRAYFVATVPAAAVSLGAGLFARLRSVRAAARGEPVGEPRPETVDAHARLLLRNALKYFVVPVWTAAGVADWWCHRRTDIQDTTGLKETAIHLLIVLEGAAPIYAALLLEIDPLILSAMIATFFLHEATAMWDVSYAVTAREVTPGEQHVHSFLEMTPLLAVSLISLLHWPQLKALAGLRTEPLRPVWPKTEPVGLGYVGALTGMFAALEMLPYVEEAVRDWRARPGRLQPA
jgi:hypothetical protein